MRDPYHAARVPETRRYQDVDIDELLTSAACKDALLALYVMADNLNQAKERKGDLPYLRAKIRECYAVIGRVKHKRDWLRKQERKARNARPVS